MSSGLSKDKFKDETVAQQGNPADRYAPADFFVI